LLLLLDYQNVDQITFSDFQTPFIVEYEGIVTSASNEILKYVAPRAMSLAVVQLFLRTPASSNILVGIYKNGIIQGSASLTTGNSQTSPIALSMVCVVNDLIELRLITPASESSALVVTLDYYIDSGGNLESYIFYSDPATDIVLLARQVGIGSGKVDSMSFDKLKKYQADVDNLLNGRLRSLYRVPLQKITSGNSPFPGAIQVIAQRLVLKMLLSDVYSEVEPNASGNIDRQATMAQEDLSLILNKNILLGGQRLKAQNYGSSPFTEPLGLNPTQNPASTLPH
jgi:hypothetical protein